MAEYIDKEKLLQKLSRMIEYCQKYNKVNGLTALFQVGDAIIDCPTADVVEVVRCKDCKHWNNGDCYRLELSKSDDFCSYGERKEE